eukprot:CAMPEP_0117649090 /NCGR_PEP_ID=MMETSP0804-20121206/776_1 /TAXON_ID=1074897 /ORGANISM="Tetraselmis astigmatica, Strain CCMP880" /LENGTH=186 /DNA_ID=CAMNT_0005454783 /DNA_START=901 /DNA_END=1462 /DNA_ORIENTATION=-
MAVARRVCQPAQPFLLQAYDESCLTGKRQRRREKWRPAREKGMTVSEIRSLLIGVEARGKDPAGDVEPACEEHRPVESLQAEEPLRPGLAVSHAPLLFLDCGCQVTDRGGLQFLLYIADCLAFDPYLMDVYHHPPDAQATHGPDERKQHSCWQARVVYQQGCCGGPQHAVNVRPAKPDVQELQGRE